MQSSAVVKIFGVDKSTIIVKINIVKLINKHPKMKNSSLLLNFLKNYFKANKDICKASATKFE